jgi:hypothetical protein
MMMSARGLPIELLDEEELRERFKQIDAAIERVKQDIEKAVADQKRAKSRVKLTNQHHVGAP